MHLGSVDDGRRGLSESRAAEQTRDLDGLVHYTIGAPDKCLTVIIILFCPRRSEFLPDLAFLFLPYVLFFLCPTISLLSVMPRITRHNWFSENYLRDLHLPP